MDDMGTVYMPSAFISHTNRLSLGAIKILNAYLSEIDFFDASERTVIFIKREYEKALGVKEIKTKSLKKYLGELLEWTVFDKINNEEIHVFEKAEFVITTSGRNAFSLTCSQKAKERFLTFKFFG